MTGIIISALSILAAAYLILKKYYAPGALLVVGLVTLGVVACISPDPLVTGKKATHLAGLDVIQIVTNLLQSRSAGLGMNITQQLLHLMGSELKVESVYGSGSHFYFELEQQIVDNEPIGDLDKRIAEQKKNFSYNVSFIAPDANILIVDDIATNRKVCRALLKDTLVKIDEASGG